MATTTTNYGFDVPTSSDLVKNGATQIALLGQDLDTFLFRPFTRNGVLNSSFNVWQRGTSIAVPASSQVYTTDRWNIANGANAMVVSRQATNDTTNLPNIQYCARVQRNAAQTSTNGNAFNNSFETINSIPYAGKTVTFSFYARSGANYSAASSALVATLYSGTGTDQQANAGYTGTATVATVTATLTTTWQRFTVSGTVAATATELATYFSFTPTGTAGANDYYELTGVMVEVGNQASPYAPATPTYATELAACQRYYESWTATSGNYGFPASAMWNATTGGKLTCMFAVPKRVAPSVAFSNVLVGSGTSSLTMTSLAFFGSGSTSGISGGYANFTVASGGTVGYAGFTMDAGSGNGFINWSAEL
jgi:hypothetical protein